MTVIAILAVLAAITLTAIGKAKTRTRSATCLSNIRQQLVALAGFVANNDAYPLFIATTAQRRRHTAQGTTWISSIFPKTGSLNLTVEGTVFDCPGTSRPRAMDPREGYMEYGYNMDGLMGVNRVGNLGLGGAADTALQEIVPVRQTQVRVPSSMIAIGDGVIGWGNTMSDGMSKIGRSATESKNRPSSDRRIRRRHLGQLNIGFCDGHAESLGLEALFSSTSDEALSRWNRDAEPHRDRL